MHTAEDAEFAGQHIPKRFRQIINILYIIIHILKVYFPCLHGLDGFLNGYLPLSSILRRITINLQRSSKTISLQFFTTIYHHSAASLQMVKPPQSVSSNAARNAIRPKRALSSKGFISFKVTLHIHLIILISLYSISRN